MHCNFIKWETFSFLHKKIFNSHLLPSAWLKRLPPNTTGPLKDLKWLFLKHRQKPYRNKEFQTQVKLNFLGMLIRNGFFKAQVKLGSGRQWLLPLDRLNFLPVFRISKRALNILILFIAELRTHHLFLLVFHPENSFSLRNIFSLSNLCSEYKTYSTWRARVLRINLIT